MKSLSGYTALKSEVNLEIKTRIFCRKREKSLYFYSNYFFKKLGHFELERPTQTRILRINSLPVRHI